MQNKIIERFCFICLSILFSEIKCLPETNGDFNTTEIKKYVQSIFPQSVNAIYSQVPQGLVISIPSSVLFEEKSYKIKENALIFLIIFGNILKNINKPCVVEGNVLTESADGNLSPLELSIVRAENIVEFLIKNSGVQSEKIRAIGFGDFAPFSDNVSYKQHLNKRIDFLILNYEWSR